MFQGNVKRNRQQAGFGQEASFPVLVDRAPSAGSKRYHKQRNSHCRPGEQLSEVSKAKPTQQYSIPGTKCVDRSYCQQVCVGLDGFCPHVLKSMCFPNGPQTHWVCVHEETQWSFCSQLRKQHFSSTPREVT